MTCPRCAGYCVEDRYVDVEPVLSTMVANKCVICGYVDFPTHDPADQTNQVIPEEPSEGAPLRPTQ